MVPNIESYIKDTNDFLRKLSEVRDLPVDVILCTVDVVGLYPHIPQNEGLQTIKETLSHARGSQKEEWTGSLEEDAVDFAELVLTSNNFEFNGRPYAQKLGTAIGSRMAPAYANIFMDKLETRLLEVFVDDIFIIRTEGEEKLRKFRGCLNNVHHAIKVT